MSVGWWKRNRGSTLIVDVVMWMEDDEREKNFGFVGRGLETLSTGDEGVLTIAHA